MERPRSQQGFVPDKGYGSKPPKTLGEQLGISMGFQSQDIKEKRESRIPPVVSRFIFAAVGGAMGTIFHEEIIGYGGRAVDFIQKQV